MMKKRFLISIFTILVAVSFIVGLAACGVSEKSESDIVKDPDIDADEPDIDVSEMDPSEGLTYIEKNGSYTVTGIGLCVDMELVIPSEHEGLPVTAIDGGAFYYCKSFTGLYIPESVTYIGDEAFYNCTNVTYVYMGNGVTYIGDRAFYSCSSLEDTNISSAATYIGDSAFEGCESLTSVRIPEEVTYVGERAFADCMSLESITFRPAKMEDFESHNCLFYNAGRSGSGIAVTIGAGVTRVPAYIFNPDSSADNAPGITSVKFEGDSKCKEIGDYAFAYCDSIVTVTIPDTVNVIDSYAFYGCSSVKTIVIPDSITLIDTSAFDGCSSLTSLTIGTGVTEMRERAFADSSSLTTVVVPDNVVSIGEAAFNGCSHLASMTLPFVGGEAGATQASAITLFGYIFGSNKFNGATQVQQHYSGSSGAYKNYYIPDSLTSVTITGGEILYGAFYSCTHIESISILMDFGSITEYAFYNCRALTELNLPCEITSVGDYAFYNCKFSDFSLFEDLTSIGKYAFSGCYALESISFSENLTSLGSYAFSACSSLTSVVIPDYLIVEILHTFYNCNSLEYIYIGSGVTLIDGGSFAGCSSLETMVLPFVGRDNKTGASSYTFLGYIFGTSSYDGGVETNQKISRTGSGWTYYIPASLTTVTITGGDIKNGAFYGCESIVNVTLDTSSAVNNYAFYHCSSLANLTIGPGVTSLGDYSFTNCANLENIYFDAEEMEDISVDNNIFYNAGKDGNGLNVTIGKDVVRIPSYLFCPNNTNAYYPPVFTTVIFEENCRCTTIGNSAFRNCYYLESITIPSSVTTIETYAFRNCPALVSLTIGSGVTSIGTYTFYECTGLEEIYFNAVAMDDLTSANYVFYSAGKDGDGIIVTVGADVTRIPAYIFYPSGSYSYVPKFTGVIFEEGSRCSSIGDYAFCRCSLLTYITIPDTVTSIGEYAFGYCWSLTSINIPDGVTDVGEGMFTYCSSLISIVIPDSVTSIGDSVFDDCTLLESVSIGSGVTSIGSYAFIRCSSLTTVVIPSRVTSIGTYAFAHCTSLSSVTIGDGIVSIGDAAFYNCSSLAIVYYSGSSEEWSSINVGADNEYLTTATIYYGKD